MKELKEMKLEFQTGFFEEVSNFIEQIPNEI